MNGLDNMIRVIVKAIGIDPEQLLNSVTGFMQHVYERLGQFDHRMVAQETKLSSIEAQLTRIADAQEQLLRLYNGRPELKLISGGTDGVSNGETCDVGSGNITSSDREHRSDIEAGPRSLSA